MTVALQHFEGNLGHAKNMQGLGHALAGVTTAALDITDVWRAVLVMTVSALDTYVHERVRNEVLTRHAAGLTGPPALDRFGIPMAMVRLGLEIRRDTIGSMLPCTKL